MFRSRWAWDLVDSLRYGQATTIRWLLALAASIHGALILISPPCGDTVWAAIFLLDAFCLWWRIFDRQPRVIWAYGVNTCTAALWGAVTYGFYVAGPPSRPLLPVLTGYIVLTLMATISVLRTDTTPRDRGNA